MPRRRRTTVLRFLVILLAVVVLVPVLAVVGAVVFVDPNAWRPQIEAAVQRASGRALHIRRLTLVPAFSPTLGAIDLALANPPGASRPDMVTIARAEVKLALLPLLAGRVEIARILLVRPDILLERDAAGRPNWRFGARPSEVPPSEALPAEAKPASPAASPAAGRAGAAPDLLVRALRIEDGRLTWSGGNGAAPLQLDLRVLDVAASGFQSPVTITAQGAYAGQALALTAETGPLARLLDQTATSPWPVKATLETPGARLAAAGGVVHPLNGAGYTLAVAGAAVNLSAIDGLLAARLPPLRQVAFAARVADVGGRLPEVTGLAVRAGASDLDGFASGLKLAHAELSAAALGEPVRAEAAGALRGVPLRVTASFGPLAALLPADPPNAAPYPPAPYPIELAAEAQGATLAVKGSVAVPARLSGIDLAVTGRIPDLSFLSRLAGANLPALRPVTLDARVADRPGMPGFSIRGLAVTAPEADVSGELLVGLGPRRTLQATLSSRRIDLGAVLAAVPSAVALPPPGESFPDLSLPDFSATDLGPPEVVPATPALPALPPPPPPLPPPLPPKHSGRLLPDARLPFAALDAADADLRLSVAELRVGGATYRDLSGRLSLQDGKLTLDPVAGTLPGGRAEFRLSVDSRAVPPPVAVALRAPGLSLKPLLAAFHLPGDIAGTAEIDADLHGAGDTPQALAAGLGGRLGVAMTDGELDNRLLGSLAGAVLAGTKLPPGLLGLDRPGSTRIRCLALRADADGGLATVSTVLLDTSRLLVYGAGTVNLRDETMALRLRPMLKAGISVVVPVRVGGSFAAPKVSSDPAANLSAVAGLVAGLGVARGTPLGALASVIANERDGDPCDPALAAARAVPRQPPPQPSPAAPPRPLNPVDVLRGVLSR